MLITFVSKENKVVDWENKVLDWPGGRAGYRRGHTKKFFYQSLHLPNYTNVTYSFSVTTFLFWIVVL
jgi:hypothetical protein